MKIQVYGPFLSFSVKNGPTSGLELVRSQPIYDDIEIFLTQLT